MKLGLLTLAVTALCYAPRVDAQGLTPPMPDAAYDSRTIGPDVSDSLVPMPQGDPAGDGSVVSVPIPGGGEVRVEGPALPEQRSLSPVENWGTNAVAPNSVPGTSPVGPRAR